MTEAGKLLQGDGEALLHHIIRERRAASFVQPVQRAARIQQHCEGGGEQRLFICRRIYNQMTGEYAEGDAENGQTECEWHHRRT